MKLKSIIAILILLTAGAFAQPGKSATVSGFIYDAANGEALIGANVYIKGLNIGASSNLSGYFAIPNVPAGKQIVVASYLGYKIKQTEIKVNGGNDNILKINLETDALQTKEVVITGDSARTIDRLFVKPISKIELNAAQINNIPRVIEADLLRSLQTLPGIQPLSDFSSSLYVRGGTPDQNLYLIDGTDVYNPEHAFGLFSTFNTNAIKKVELSKGGFSADYGGRLSSILNVTNLDGNRNRFQGDVAISLLSGSTTLQAPLGSIGSISGSFRRTYLDQTIAKFVDEIPNYYFYDGNLKAFLDLNEKNKVVLSFYGGKDNLNYMFDEDREDSPEFNYDWGNTTGSINWKRIVSQDLFASFWITYSRFNSHFDFEEFNVTERNSIDDLTFKGNLEYYLSKQLNLKFGFEQKNFKGIFYEKFPGGKVDSDKKRNQYTSYITTSWRPNELWDIEAGLRFDYFDSDADYKNLDPRFSAKFRLSETSNLKFSTGIFHQYLNRIPRLFITSIWTSADQYTKGSTAYHYIAGFQKELWQIYEFEIEAYYKRYDNIHSFNQNFGTELTPDRYSEDGTPVFTETKSLFTNEDGRSMGIELLLRKDFGALTGWIGYSLAKTEYKSESINRGKYYVPRHDRTSTLNVVANMDIVKFWDELFDNPEDNSSSKWILGFSFVYGTGQPITLPGSAYGINAVPSEGKFPSQLVLYPTEINTLRLPAYSRGDISLTYEKQYKGWSLAPYLQIYNVGARKNVWFIDYENEIKNGILKPKIKYLNMLPLLPSIGVNIKF